MSIDPGTQVALDTDMAFTDKKVVALVQAIRIGTAEVGETQALADVVSHVIEKYARKPEAPLAAVGLLSAALLRLARKREVPDVPAEDAGGAGTA